VKSSGTAPADCASPTVGSVMDFTYNFDQDPGAGVADNGNVLFMNDYVQGNSYAYTYDELNRLKTAAASIYGPNCWGLDYGYDIWGNLLSATVTQCSAPSLSLTVNTKNQISNPGIYYDAAGNFTHGISVLLTYDAENRIVNAGGIAYSYNADGMRVKRAGSGVVDTAYWYGPTGEVLAESDLSGVIQSEFVFFNGQRIARRDEPGGVVHYTFADHLGSASVVTTATGSIEDASDYYPFGQERVILDTDRNHYKFTGKERDVETGLYYFGARYYHENGWFMTPDEFTGGPVDAFSSNDPSPPGPLPYADITNPQSLNKYTYTYNNPLRYTNANGHCQRVFNVL
jgi:RHS repeat-associated protein